MIRVLIASSLLGALACTGGAGAAPDAAEKIAERRVTASLPMPDAAILDGAPAYEALVRQAKSAYNNGQYELALAKAKEALVAKPGDEQAGTIAGLAACRMKNGEEAKAFMAQLKGQRAQMVRQICIQSGFHIE